MRVQLGVATDFAWDDPTLLFTVSQISVLPNGADSVEIL